MLRALILLVVVAIPVSADTVKLTIRTDPAGATVYLTQPVTFSLTSQGYAPVTVEYEPGKHFFRDRRCVRITPITVRWASGAEAFMEYVNICGATGKNQQIVFVRPMEAPGRDLDVAFALELERIAADNQRTATDQRRQRWAALADQVSESFRRQAEISLWYSQRRTNCTSSLVGSYVYTTCY